MENHKKIKDMPKDTRPYEKCLKHGASSLADSELLAIVLKSGYKGVKSIELADFIIKKAGDNGLTGLLRLSLHELLEVKGIGEVKAVMLLSIFEMAKRIKSNDLVKGMILNSPGIIVDHFMERLRYKEKEELLLLMLNSKSLLLGTSTISVGTVNSSFASPREIFLEALKYKAVNIVLLHNHPSGDPTPSKADIKSTSDIFDMGKVIGINLIDHIIIGDNKYISFSEKGLI
jgi:DNA repair protein RadC